MQPTPLQRFLLTTCGAISMAALAATGAHGQEQGAGGQDAPAPPPLSSEETAGKDLTRVLHLANGSFLRTRARRTEEGWWIREQQDWRLLPQGLVVRVVDERPLLARARELEKEAAQGAPARRVPLADWMLREGLVQEAFAQIDRVLAVEPDDPTALAWLAKPPVALQMFAGQDLDGVLRTGANGTLSVRELAVMRAAELAEPEQLLQRLEKDLGSHSPRLRAQAGLALRRLHPGEHLRPLLSRAVLDGSPDVRRECSLTLKRANEEALILPVVRALGSNHAGVRENAVEALAWMGYPAAVEPLLSHLAVLSSPQSAGGGAKAPRSHIFIGRQVAYVQDFDVEVAQAASVADPIVNTLVEGSVLDVRVIGVTTQTFAAESRKVRSALSQLTGANPGRDNRSWMDWWAKNSARYTGKPAGPTTGS